MFPLTPSVNCYLHKEAIVTKDSHYLWGFPTLAVLWADTGKALRPQMLRTISLHEYKINYIVIVIKDNSCIYNDPNVILPLKNTTKTQKFYI